MWFCNDGEVLPPKAYACRPHGGGHQHGQWSEQTLELRDDGYFIANLLAGISPEAYRAQAGFEDQYAQLLIEKFLMGIDNGWIFQRAIYYRGAIQDEDERAGGRSLLLSLVGDEHWLGPRFAALRTGVQMLPHGQGSASISKVRQWSAALADEDSGFLPLRVKIHGAPSAADAQSVRDYARDTRASDSAREDLSARYEALATEIDAIYQSPSLDDELARWSGLYGLPDGLAKRLRSAAEHWDASAGTREKFTLSATLMAEIRSSLTATSSLNSRLQLLDASLRLEREHYASAAQLREEIGRFSRAELLQLMRAAATAGYGAGLINTRLHDALDGRFVQLDPDRTALSDYRALLNYAGLAPGWGVQALRQYFYSSMQKLAKIEPRALLFIQDQLRASPLLFYSTILDELQRDAGQLSGISHALFGDEAGGGLHPLNPGFARGTLHAQPDLDDIEALDPEGIYVLPETVAELPPVAGIITFGTGNPLSHVQLLARNLGIPNVSAAPRLGSSLRAADGESVVLAVTPAGSVRIARDEGVIEQAEMIATAPTGIQIEPDLEKLDLTLQRNVALAELTVEDSGRTVGPKAAKLGELARQYPDAVARGMAIPFGVFKQVVLDRPHASGATVFEWMQSSYAELAKMPTGEGREAATETFREQLYQQVLNTPLPADFITMLREDLARLLGEEFEQAGVGMFVRSDTNVEDLPGFTGAGLNLTLPNVTSFDALLAAIPRVWASPFTRRAFSWRQSYMTQPEHVYTSILLLESVPSDKSGVLVTADIDTAEAGVLSVAVNEGLGGAVDGQAAESLRIDTSGAGVTVLATATAPLKRVLNAAGGIDKVAVSGSHVVLNEQDINTLRVFANTLPERFPSLVDEQGNLAVADVEFGFVGDRLRLFQIRPFVQSDVAASHTYLLEIDANIPDRGADLVDLQAVPGSGP